MEDFKFTEKVFAMIEASKEENDLNFAVWRGDEKWYFIDVF